MSVLAIANTGTAPLNLPDVGIVLPPQSTSTFSDPGMVRDLGGSASLRAAIQAGIAEASCDGSALTLDELPCAFYGAGFGPLKALVFEDNAGNLWSVKVVAGALVVTPIP